MSINEKAFEAFMQSYHENGGTALGFRKSLEAYDAAKAEQQNEKSWEKIAMETHLVKLTLIDEVISLREKLKRELGGINHYEMAIARDFPDGTSLYVKENGVGGHTYYTDEIGCGVMVWDTALVSEKALLAAIEHNKHTDIEDGEPQ